MSGPYRDDEVTRLRTQLAEYRSLVAQARAELAEVYRAGYLAHTRRRRIRLERVAEFAPVTGLVAGAVLGYLLSLLGFCP